MKQLNPDKQFYGFTLQTRRHFHDENIIKQCLGGDPYRIPNNANIVVDIGSNIGATVLSALSKGAKLIYAFEPFSQSFQVLKHNIEVNGFSDKVVCIQKGVGKPDRQTKLFLHPSNSGAISSYLTQKGLTAENYETVEFISIHNVFDLYDIKHCDLLKMDCENSEYDIIHDLDDELASRIAKISVEFHDKHKVKELVDKLSQWYIPNNVHRYEWVFKRK